MIPTDGMRFEREFIRMQKPRLKMLRLIMQEQIKQGNEAPQSLENVVGILCP